MQRRMRILGADGSFVLLARVLHRARDRRRRSRAPSAAPPYCLRTLRGAASRACGLQLGASASEARRSSSSLKARCAGSPAAWQQCDRHRARRFRSCEQTTSPSALSAIAFFSRTESVDVQGIFAATERSEAPAAIALRAAVLFKPAERSKGTLDPKVARSIPARPITEVPAQGIEHPAQVAHVTYAWPRAPGTAGQAAGSPTPKRLRAFRASLGRWSRGSLDWRRTKLFSVRSMSG